MKDVGGKIVDLYRQALKTGYYPNPTRRGCPEPAVLKQLARKDLGAARDWAAHVCECSPCFRDVAQFQQRRRLIVAGTAMTAAIALGPLIFVASARVGSLRTVEVASVPGPDESPSRFELVPASGTRGRNVRAGFAELSPRGTTFVLCLAVDAEPASVYDVLVKDVNTGLAVDARHGLPVSVERRIEIALKSAAVPPGSYIVETVRRDDQRSEQATVYRFRILPLP